MEIGVPGQFLAHVAEHVEEALKPGPGFAIAQHHPMGA